MLKDFISTKDKVVSLLTYLTVGWVGLIYCIVLFIKGSSPSRFIRYNVFQSMLIAFLYFTLCLGLGLLFQLLTIIPFINYLASQIMFLFNRPILFDYSFIQVFMIGLFLYLGIMSAFGKYPRVYKLSKIIDNMAQ